MMNKEKTTIDREEVKKHFDSIADQYDNFKVHASYYYFQVKTLIKSLLPQSENQKIVEIGCGTGQLIAELNPRRGLGIDISDRMIQIARTRWKDRSELDFEIGEAETIKNLRDWDIVIMGDVLEHLYDSYRAIHSIYKSMRKDSLLIIIWANHRWTKILHLLEKLKMKMPEGPHHWESLKSILAILSETDFKIEQWGTRCLIPGKIPCADFINSHFFRWTVIKNLGLIQFIVVRKI